MQKDTAEQRIEKLYYAKFQEEFGFKPSSKRQQRFFAMIVGGMERLKTMEQAGLIRIHRRG